MIKKFDSVKLKNEIDSPFLVKGDTGQVLSEVLDDGYVAVAFDNEFEDSYDCEGLVKEGNGWFVHIEDLEVITQ